MRLLRSSTQHIARARNDDQKTEKMKKTLLITAIAVLTTLATISFAQSPPHPNGGNNPGTGNTPVGGGAPLGGGLLILVSLGIGYSAKKIYHLRIKNKQLD